MSAPTEAEEQLPEFPFYYRDKIGLLHPDDGYIGIITFWTQFNRDRYLKYPTLLSVGNLYTADGFKYIVLNSFLTSKLSAFIFYGNDRNSIYPMIVDFFNKTESSQLYKDMHSQLSDLLDEGVDITYIIHTFISRFKDRFYFCDHYSKLDSIIQSIEQVPTLFTNLHFYKCNFQTSKRRLPSERVGFVCRNNDLQQLWLNVLHLVTTFGAEKKTKVADNDHYELLDVMYVLQATDRHVDSIISSSIYPISDSFLVSYIDEIVTPNVPEGLSYTYGERIHRTLPVILDKLVDDRSTRQAHICLWDPREDPKSTHPPCLTDIDINIQNDVLYLTAHFRSHDAFAALRTNIYGITKLQEKIIAHINDAKTPDCNKLIAGDITIFANSCHVYLRDYQNLVKLKYPSNCTCDYRGYFVIEKDQERKIVKMNHYDYSNNLLHKFEFKRPDSFEIDEVSFFISDMHHAMYLQRQIDIAFACIRENRPFIQDSSDFD